MIYILFALLLPPTFADPPLSCEAALIYMTAYGHDSELRLLRRYRNEDRFAGWLARRGLEREELKRLFDEAESAFHAKFTPDLDRQARIALGDERSREDHLQPLHDEFDSARDVGSAPPARNFVLRPNFDDDDESYLRLSSVLRRGDTVRFSDRTFRLGPFLGQGNANIIFALDGEPGVLRIPYAREFLRKRGYTNRISIENYVEREPRWVRRRARIIAHGQDMEWVVSERVNGTLNAARLVTELGHREALRDLLKYRQDLRAEDHYGRIETVIANAIRPILLMPQRARARREARALAPERRLQVQRLIADTRFSPYDVKQYVWDEDSRHWILVDWE